MIKSGYVGDIANLLGFELVVHSRSLYMVDEDDNYIPLVFDKDHYRFPFEKDGKTYLLQFNDQLLRLSNSELESIQFSNDEISYMEKEKDSVYNKSFVFFNPSYINFYHRQTIDDEACIATSVKMYSDFGGMQESTTIYTKTGNCKDDRSIEITNGINSIKHMKRSYSTEGKMTGGCVYSEPIATDITDYIKNSVANNETVRLLLDKLNEMIPGFCEYYATKNNDLKELLKNMYNKKTM